MICMEIRPENENGTRLGEKRRTNNETEHGRWEDETEWDGMGMGLEMGRAMAVGPNEMGWERIGR